MTKAEVMLKAINGQIRWVDAAVILGVTDRHIRRLRERYEEYGFDGIRDQRGKRTRRSKIAVEVVREVCRLKREEYADLNVQHFHEKLTEEHGVLLSYSWTNLLLQKAGLVEKQAGRGKYFRKRERRPMRGMLMHLDASMHEWVAGQAKHDLVVAMDDATGEVLHMEFVPEEGTKSTFSALRGVLTREGRFAELYTDRGSHFCRTEQAGQGPNEVQNGQVTRALRALGIRHILARTPQARGRSERMFGTLQGRLPQELRLAGITHYGPAADRVLEHMRRDVNRRFAVTPAQPESAFVPLVGIQLELLLSVQHERTVHADNTVQFRRLQLQLPEGKTRVSYARCVVTVNEFLDDTLGVVFQGQLLARFAATGEPSAQPIKRKKTA